MEVAPQQSKQLSRTTRQVKKPVNVNELLNFGAVKRMAKAAHPSISLTHTKGRKTSELRVVKSKRVEFKGPDGRYPDAIFLKGTNQEVSKEEADSMPDGAVEKHTEHVMVSDELLVGPVREELYDFLRQYVGHILSETTGRNGSNDVTTVVVTRQQVLDATRDLRLSFTNFYNTRKFRSKTRKDHTYAGAIAFQPFRKMLNFAVDGAIADKSISFRKIEGERHVTFAPGAVDEIKTVAEQRISSLFYSASAFAGAHRVALHHFVMAKKNAPVIWDVQR
jgi:hypothetical protein